MYISYCMCFRWVNNFPLSYQCWTNIIYRQYNTYSQVGIDTTEGEKYLNYAENKGNLATTKRKSKNIIYPHFGNSSQCTMMLLYNLAYPEWISIDCNEKLLHHIVCADSQSQSIHDVTVSPLQELSEI